MSGALALAQASLPVVASTATGVSRYLPPALGLLTLTAGIALTIALRQYAKPDDRPLDLGGIPGPPADWNLCYRCGSGDRGFQATGLACNNAANCNTLGFYGADIAWPTTETLIVERRSRGASDPNRFNGVAVWNRTTTRRAAVPYPAAAAFSMPQVVRPDWRSNARNLPAVIPGYDDVALPQESPRDLIRRGVYAGTIDIGWPPRPRDRSRTGAVAGTRTDEWDDALPIGLPVPDQWAARMTRTVPRVVPRTRVADLTPPGQKEIKMAFRVASQVARKIKYNMTTEIRDAVEAIWDNIPDDCKQFHRKGRLRGRNYRRARDPHEPARQVGRINPRGRSTRPSLQRMAKDIYDHADCIQWAPWVDGRRTGRSGVSVITRHPGALQDLAVNEAVDRVFGKIGNMAKIGTQRGGFTAGLQFGGGLENRAIGRQAGIGGVSDYINQALAWLGGF